MKQFLFFLLVFGLVFEMGYSQGSYPVSQNLGAPSTLVIAKGGLKADSSLIIPAFSDTAKANISPYLNKYAGSLIRVQDTLYMRNNALNKWVSISSGGGGGSGTVTSISSGYGITNTPNPITTTGTIRVDTSVSGLSGKYLRIVDTSYINLWTKNGAVITNKQADTIKITSNLKIDTSAQVGIYTKNAAVTSKIHTNGLIASQEGFLIADPTSSQANNSAFYTGIFKNLFNSGYINSMKFSAGGYTIATMTNTLVSTLGSNQSSFNLSPTLSNYLTSLSGTRSVLNIAPPISPIAANSLNYNQINIQPTYNQTTLGTGILRGIYYDPTLSSLNTSPHFAFESTSGGIKFGGMSASTDTTTYKPLAIDGSGNLAKMSNWISGGGTPYVDSIYRTIGVDSIYYKKSSNTYAIKDSIGIPFATASGTDTYTATISGVTSYVNGNAYLIRFTNGNTSGCTLDINGLGAKVLYRNNDGVLIGGDIISGAEMLCVYNSTLNGFQVIGTAPNTLLGYVTNADTVTITKGMPVYAFGGQGDRMTVKRAYNTTDATSAQTVGLVLSTSIGVNQKGFIIIQGLLDGLSILPTSTWADGDPVYLGDTPGTITNVKPSAPNHLVYLGVVTTASNGSSGRLYTRIQNGYELQELHNVALTNPPSNNDGLFYDSATSLWKNKSVSAALGYTPISPSDTSVFDRKSTASYSFMANNTNATANAIPTTFRDTSGVYTGTITWTGTTAPSGTTNHFYQWQQVGKMVTLQLVLAYGTPGSAVSNVTMTLPADCPTPFLPAFNTGALAILYYGLGHVALNTTSTTGVVSVSGIRRNAADNGNELFINFASTGPRIARVQVTYRAQ